MVQEVWLPIQGYEGLYEVSHYGRIRSLDRIVRSNPINGFRFQKGRIKGQSDNGEGYLIVSLYKDGVGRLFYAHRLIATAFISDPPDENSTVNHKDGNKYNNYWRNLEWMTMADNHKHAKETGLYIGFPTKHVQQWYGGLLVAEFKSASEAARVTKICRSSIAECCRPYRDNRGHTAGGFEWRFAVL